MRALTHSLRANEVERDRWQQSGEPAFRPQRGGSTVHFEDIPDSLVADFKSKICQSTLNAVVSPRRILASEPEYEVNDLLADHWSSCCRLTFVGRIPLPSHQLPMPPQDRFRSKDV